MRRLLPLLALLVALPAAAQWLPGQSPAERLLLRAPTVKRAVPGAVYPISPGDAPSRGPADAPVVVVEYSDFQCPYCKRASQTLKRLLERFPKEVRLVFKNHPLPRLHPHAELAAEAALAAGAQGKFWEMHDLLFAFQPALSRADIDTYAQSLGLDMVRFNYDLSSGRFRERVAREAREVLSLGITGVPAVFVNGKYIKGAKPLSVYVAAVQAALGEMEAAADAGDGDEAGCEDEVPPAGPVGGTEARR